MELITLMDTPNNTPAITLEQREAMRLHRAFIMVSEMFEDITSDKAVIMAQAILNAIDENKVKH
jgi:hypothetical protein